MKDPDILTYFDGRPTADMLLSAFEVGDGDRITAFAYELGYRQVQAGAASRTTYRMVFSRDDSPDAQQRAAATLNRVRGGGPVLPDLPATPAGRVSPGAAAVARRSVAAYESSSAKGLAVVIGLVGVGALLAAVALRDSPANAIAAVVVGVLFFAMAVATPSLMRRRYARDRAIVDRFNQERAADAGVPPPPPPPPGPAGSDGWKDNGQ
ncbi:hypothetical protein ACFVYR_25385 [Streptomyces sp. NPDC058284]|uniref:hypothetical protein n=1 Tax=unclassified Streptomyces TaxID=2593676 RepID=UPI00364A85A7